MGRTPIKERALRKGKVMNERERLILRMQGGGFYTLEQALCVLEVDSPATVRNWLEGGHFPGAVLCSDGHWVFDGLEVLEVAKAIGFRKMNAERKLEVPDLGDCICYSTLTLRRSDPECPVHGTAAIDAAFNDILDIKDPTPLPNEIGDETYWKHR
jgi:hypothetical protein